MCEGREEDLTLTTEMSLLILSGHEILSLSPTSTPSVSLPLALSVCPSLSLSLSISPSLSPHLSAMSQMVEGLSVAISMKDFS